MEWLIDGVNNNNPSSPSDVAYWEKEATALRVKLDFAAQALSSIVDKLIH